MRKLRNSYFLVFLSVLFANLVLPISTVIAEVPLGSQPDQYCDNNSVHDADNGWRMSAHTLSQTFTPGNDTDTWLMLALAADGPATTATAEIRKVTGGDALITSKTAAIEHAQVAWVDFDINDVHLDRTKQYRIVVTSPSPTAYWVVSAVPCYSGGLAIVDGINMASQDFGFVFFGYNNPTPAQPGTTPTPSGTTPKATTPTTSTTESQVQKPFLTSVEVNGKKVDTSTTDILNLKKSDRVTFTGTTTKGTTVGLLVGSDTFETIVNDSGAWTTTLDARLFQDGVLEVQGQASKDGKTSEKQSYFKLEVKDDAALTASKRDFKWKREYTYATLGIIAILIASGLGLFFFIKDRKAVKNTKPEVKEPKEPTDTQIGSK